MSEDTPAAQLAADRMLAEVGRVLKPAGKYLCVTLSQVMCKATVVTRHRTSIYTDSIRDTAYKLMVQLALGILVSMPALLQTAL
jgi:ubiquinone/menaquinone biosynthesis C-methylase UbiE